MQSMVAAKRGLFTLGLLLCTWIPMAFFLTVGSLATAGTGTRTTKAVLIFLSGIHVPATALLYGDRAFRPLVVANKARYIYLPLAMIVGSGLVFALGGRGAQAYFWLAFWAWQAYHYGRQNVGLYALAGTAGGWRPQRAERRVLELATVCGILGTFKTLGMEISPAYLHGVFDALYRVGAVGFILVLLLAVPVYLANRTPFSWSRTAFFVTLTVFFLPIFLSSGMDGAFLSYAIAHGVQYLLIMTALCLDVGLTEGRRGVSGRMLILPAVALVIALVGFQADLQHVGWIRSDPLLLGLADLLLGMSLGCTLAHFVIDAGAWRLSLPPVRHYLTRRFSFLFARA